MGFLDKLFGFLKSPFATAEEIQALVKQGALIIDVRTPQEYRQGNIKNSQNIPLAQIGSKAKAISQKSKPVILYCRSGGRANSAASILRNHGIEVYNGGGLAMMQNALRK